MFAPLLPVLAAGPPPVRGSGLPPHFIDEDTMDADVYVAPENHALQLTSRDQTLTTEAVPSPDHVLQIDSRAHVLTDEAVPA